MTKTAFAHRAGRTLLAACMGLAAAGASALPFTLTPNATTVQAGDAFSLTLAYDGADPIDFGLDITSVGASFSAPGTLTLDAVVALDGNLFGLATNPAVLPGTLPASVSVFLLGALGGLGTQVDLLRFDFTVGAASESGDLALTVLGESLNANTFNPVFLDESARVQIQAAPTAAVPEGGTLGALLVGGLAAAWILRRRIQPA